MKKKFHWGVSLFIACFWLASVAAQGKGETYTVSESGEAYELVLAYDRQQEPAYFVRNIFTPVCLDSVCKPVRIKLFWDLLGNYLKYEVPADEPLTKLDHKEFTPEDHAKLQGILSNENSLLKDFKLEDLVDSTSQHLSDSVDAVTGATKNTIKNEVIEGALYTCYTLWHLAHGPVVNEIQEIFKTKLDTHMLHRFLRSTNFHYVYFALDEVMDAEGVIQDGFLPDVLAVLASDNVFAARHVWQRINLQYFAKRKEQETLWCIFVHSPYTLQVAFLKRMKQLDLDPGLVPYITDYLPKLNNVLFKQTLGVLATQDVLPRTSQEKLLAYLTSADKEKAEAVYNAMKGHPKLSEAFHKQLRIYSKP
jgi:hypothetical protein